jgi:hypothetical protein
MRYLVLVIIFILVSCVPAAPPQPDTAMQVGTTRHCVDLTITDDWCYMPSDNRIVNGWWYGYYHPGKKQMENKICVSKRATKHSDQPMIYNKDFEVYYPNGVSDQAKTAFHEWFHYGLKAFGFNPRFDDNYGTDAAARNQ